MYCAKCGAQNDDNAEFCSGCGASLRRGSVRVQDDEGVGALGIVLFCLPIVGAIMYFLWKDDKPRKAQTACHLALAGVGVGIVLQILVALAGG